MFSTGQLTKCWLAILTLGCGQAAMGQSQPADAPPPAVEAAAAAPALPDLELAPMDKFDSSATYLQSIASDVAELERKAGATADAAQRIELLLAAANLVLAYELEPACSWAAIGLGGHTDPTKVDGLLKKTDRLLSQAQTIIDGDGSGEADRSAEFRSASTQLEQLKSFATAIGVYLAEGDENDDTAIRQAASRLSVLLEDNDERVLGAATLWHALLRSRRGDPARAARTLPLSLARPAQQSLPYGLFSRLLRCRLLAQRGSHAVALGLLSQMEERLREWFVSEADQANALRATTVTAIKVLEMWQARLSKPDQADQRAWCTDRIKWLVDRRLGPDQRHLLRLRPAIPIIAHVPQLGGEDARSSTDGNGAAPTEQASDDPKPIDPAGKDAPAIQGDPAENGKPATEDDPEKSGPEDKAPPAELSEEAKPKDHKKDDQRTP